MHTYQELSQTFQEHFNRRHFPQEPASLYDAAEYILSFGGKRIRPVMCLMGNELFSDIDKDCYQIAIAIELFHNFSLIHDDIMDKAPLRRGLSTVHTKYSEPTALLSGDVMLVMAYNYLNKISQKHLHGIIELFNRTAMQVCEGQQLDMNFEKQASVDFEEYAKMIELKTSVLLAASLQLGAKLGGAGEGNQKQAV
jgi:geranylgeranyl diphosphate synthase type II